MKKFISVALGSFLLATMSTIGVSAEEPTDNMVDGTTAVVEEFTEPEVTTTQEQDDTVYTIENDEWLSHYLNSDTKVDTEGNAAYLGEQLIDYTQKGMYTVTARDGSVFYLIIDFETSEVFFLNKVDVADISAILEESGESLPSNISTKNVDDDYTVTEGNGEVVESETLENGEPVVTTKTTETSVETEKSSGSMVMVVVFVIAGVAFVGGYYFLKIKPSKKNKFDDDDDDFDDEEDDNEDNSEF